MEPHEVEEKVIAALAKIVGINPSNISRDTSLVNDLNFDSLDSVEAAMVLEDIFDITIEDEDVERLRTIGEIVEYVKDKMREPKTAKKRFR